MEPYGHLGMPALNQLARFLRDGARDPQGALAFADAGCESCHPIAPGETGAAPNLHGYGSEAWLTGFIADPASPLYYGSDNRMPAFRNKLTEREIAEVVAYLRLLEREPPVRTFIAAAGGPDTGGHLE
jgi:mono/diheme cytochrome c family protein